VLTVIQLA